MTEPDEKFTIGDDDYAKGRASNQFTASIERSVLCDLLLNPRIAADISKIIDSGDFINLRYGNLFRLICSMAAELGPDAVTGPTIMAESMGYYAAEIRAINEKRMVKDEERFPNQNQLGQLFGQPIYGNPVADAHVMARLSAGRRWEALGMRVVQDAQSLADPTVIGQWVIQEATSIRDGHRQQLPDATLLEDLMDRPDEPFDWLLTGLLERRDRFVLTGAEGKGKALGIETPIPTPSGWTTIGEIKVGDLVFHADGSPVRVIATTEIMHDRPCYRVEFSDGAYLIADEQHQWLTETLRAREAAAKASRRGELKSRGTDQRHKRRAFPAVVTTGEIAGTLVARNGHCLNHSIEVCAPLEYPESELPIDPYLLGYWLGNGTSRRAQLTCHEDDAAHIAQSIISVGYTVGTIRPDRRTRAVSIGIIEGFGRALRENGLLQNKHIPESYLRGSVAQRVALLQGLMDSDGYVDNQKPGYHQCEFTTTRRELADGFMDLALGLGIKVTCGEGVATLNGREIGPKWRMAFTSLLPAFRLQRKLARQTSPSTRRSRLRYITKVERVPSVPVRCIQVEREDGLFVIGRECIITHNSVLLRQIGLCLAGGMSPFSSERVPPGRVLVVDCENSERQWRRNARPVVLALRQMRADPSKNLFLTCLPRIEITSTGAQSYIHRLIDETNPDLVIIGPLYRLHGRAIQTDDEAGPVLASLDTIRDRGCALMLEAHAGHTKGEDGGRDWRPRGSSAILGWPEFGFGLAPDAEDSDLAHLYRWRGDRDERGWPEHLARGGRLPWSQVIIPDEGEDHDRRTWTVEN
jgi:AAA domain/LAGLIDADG-like domain